MEPRHTRVRKAGPHGNYWYAVELERNLRPGDVKEVRFWGESIALFCAGDGKISAVENRCAHRRLPLTKGRVEGNNLVCQYHGWCYDGGGKCVSISHELFGQTKFPRIQIRSYPVQTAYGLVWIFPGDAELASKVPLPQIPQLQGTNPWPVAPIDVTIKAHFTMVVENVCDFNHAHLHKHKEPFTPPKLREWKRDGDTIRVRYETSFAQSKIARLVTEKKGKGLDSIELWYQYPYQGSNIANKYYHWMFMLPEDERTTRCFFLFLFGPIEVPVPFVSVKLPDFLRRPVLHLANLFYIKPLLGEDVWALEAEQVGFDTQREGPVFEFNPVVGEFQTMTLEKWDDWNARSGDGKRRVAQLSAEPTS